MLPFKAIRILLCMMMVLLYVSGVQASMDEHEHESLAAHVHGQAVLTVVMEKNQLFMELETPAINVLGFEHKPNNKTQNQSFNRALDLFNQGKNLFVFQGTQCQQVSVKVNAPKWHDESSEEHEEHAHEHEHEHEKEESENSHSEFLLSYVFNCSEIKNLTEIEVSLFELFSGFDMIKAEWIFLSGQGAVKLDAKNRTIKVN